MRVRNLNLLELGVCIIMHLHELSLPKVADQYNRDKRQDCSGPCWKSRLATLTEGHSLREHIDCLDCCPANLFDSFLFHWMFSCFNLFLINF